MAFNFHRASIFLGDSGSLFIGASLKAGYDEAIMLNEQGFITDGSGENVFIAKDGVLYTPPVSAGCLDGITRDSIMRIAHDAGYTVIERNLSRFDLDFMRHTGEWVPLHQGLTLDQCLEAIRDDPWFTP
jgi:hypothetical protein